MTHPNYRPGRLAPSATSTPGPVPAPHAALLIDFDNVTLGVRSDLTKELKDLLNSDIIRGKVAVQRAYADWRRYPQYVVPLSERSIDLIWATAVGPTKKNATDIRLAVDAIELVFTRPEIGTFIILSGDSDFSSLVIKLKEYGKYVIGVGIRDSASDLLIQNCDEYYSYNELAGLTKESEVPSVQRDPWELVQEAVGQMVRNGDVMRSDRLKQVMQHIDPNFDERNAGFNRFSKFVTEAGQRGLVKVIKLDNGQFEVGPLTTRMMTAPTPRGAPAGPPAEPATAGDGNGREEGRRTRGRGRRGRGGGSGAGGPERTERARGGEGTRTRTPDRGERTAAAPGKVAEAAGRHERMTLAAAFQLLTRALGELPVPVGHEQLRARMAALHGREDQLLEPSRFTRLLRQANDAEVADVRKVGEDTYEVAPRHPAPPAGRAALRFEEPSEPASPPHEPEMATLPDPPPPPPSGSALPQLGTLSSAQLRYRRGSRAPLRASQIPLIGMVDIEEADAEPVTAAAEPAGAAAETTEHKRSRRGRRPGGKRKAAPASSGAHPATPPEMAEPGSGPAPLPGPKRRPRRKGKAS